MHLINTIWREIHGDTFFFFLLQTKWLYERPPLFVSPLYVWRSRYWAVRWHWGVPAPLRPPSRPVSTTSITAATPAGDYCIWTPWVRRRFGSRSVVKAILTHNLPFCLRGTSTTYRLCGINPISVGYLQMSNTLCSDYYFYFFHGFEVMQRSILCKNKYLLCR